MWACSPLVLVLVTFSSSSFGLRLPIHRARNSRLSILAADVSQNQHALTMQNVEDNFYNVNVNIGGQDVVVNLDTGSSDLWLRTSALRSSHTSDIPINLTYGKGSVSGLVAFAPLTFAGFEVTSQALVRGEQVLDEEPLLKSGASGLMGLGFPVGSSINTAIKHDAGAASTLGRSALENIFALNTTLPNFFTLLLGRADDPGDERAGVFTVSEYIESFSTVVNAPKLISQTPDHWSVLVDGVKIGGNSISLTSAQSNVPPGKAIAVLDSGFTFPPIPAQLVSQIYGSIPGAVRMDDVPELGVEWLVPCDQMISVSFTVGGVDFPVNPLDLSRVSTALVGGQNTTVCFNTYQTFTLDPQSFSGFDMILGDAFLRNAYVSFDYGSFNAQGELTEQPFMQMLPVTNMNEAQQEFSAVRQIQLQGLPTPFSPEQIRAAAMGQAPLPQAAPAEALSMSQPLIPSSMPSSTPLSADPAGGSSSSSGNHNQTSHATRSSAWNCPLVGFSVLALIVVSCL